VPGDARIRAESLRKSYRSGKAAVAVLDGLSLEVRPRERLAVIGASGSGKSTLLHVLGGLDRPSSGTVYFGHREITSLSDESLSDFRNRELGFLWQNPSLLPEFSALENVMMPLLIRAVNQSEAARLASSRLAEVGLESRRSHRAGELSGGEQQRVALARALVTNPQVLLLDEPTGSLDHQTGEMVASLHRAHQLTSICVTHNRYFAFQCDRVLELRDGVLQEPDRNFEETPSLRAGATRLDGGNYV
jgi:lipoprotein-releasing system ATP-binding protein